MIIFFAVSLCAQLGVEPARIAPNGEPGQPLRFEGRVVDASGHPIADAEVVAWHTDNHGVYGEAEGGGPRLKGTTTTDSEGWFHFQTIMPAAYTNQQRIPAHIHVRISSEDHGTMIAEVHFQGDPLLSQAQRRKAEGDAPFSDVVRVDRSNPRLHKIRCDFSFR